MCKITRIDLSAMCKTLKSAHDHDVFPFVACAHHVLQQHAIITCCLCSSAIAAGTIHKLFVGESLSRFLHMLYECALKRVMNVTCDDMNVE